MSARNRWHMSFQCAGSALVVAAVVVVVVGYTACRIVSPFCGEDTKWRFGTAALTHSHDLWVCMCVYYYWSRKPIRLGRPPYSSRRRNLTNAASE